MSAGYLTGQTKKGIEQGLAFILEWRTISGISHASGTSKIIVNPSAIMSGVNWPGKNPEEKYVFNGAGIMEGMIELLEMEIIEGRSFSYAFQSDIHQIIINEAASPILEPQGPICQVIDFYGDAEIVGVLKIFHFKSFYKEVKLFFSYRNVGLCNLWWYFVGAGLLTMVIALLTVSFQSVKAALMNPVESLRSE